MSIILLVLIGYGVYFCFYKRFRIRLKAAGPNHDAVVQLIKEATEWGLREAENIVAGTPYMLSLAYLNYFKVRTLVADLKKAGADAEMVICYFWQKEPKEGCENK